MDNSRLKELLGKYSGATGDEAFVLANEIAQEIAENASFLAVMDLGGSPIKRLPDGSLDLPDDARIFFPGINASDGNSYIPFFTDEEELSKWEYYRNGDVEVLTASFDALYSISNSMRSSIVIDPFGNRFIMSSDLVEHIKNVRDSRKSPIRSQTVPEDTKIMVGNPQRYPKELYKAIVDHAASVETIKTVWLKVMKEGEDGDVNFLIVVDADEDSDDLYYRLGEAATPYLPEGMGLRLLPAKSLWDEALDGEPVYRRS